MYTYNVKTVRTNTSDGVTTITVTDTGYNPVYGPDGVLGPAQDWENETPIGSRSTIFEANNPDGSFGFDNIGDSNVDYEISISSEQMRAYDETRGAESFVTFVDLYYGNYGGQAIQKAAFL